MELIRPDGNVIVRPVPEHRADEELGIVYGDLKATLGVPWVGVVTQAYAHYRPFFLEAWRQFRPTAASAFFHDASSELRRLAETEVASLEITPVRRGLETAGYSERELAQIESLLDLFNEGNPKYFILATVIRAAVVHNRRLGSGRVRLKPDTTYSERSAPIGAIPVMVEEHHTFGDLRALYGDIKTTLNLPFVNSDYKAMARWPGYLKQAWEGLKPRLAEPAYGRARQRLHARAAALIDELPFPFEVDRDAAAALGMGGAEIEELARTAGLFQWLLSGLILNVTYFQAAISDPSRTRSPSC